MGRYYIVNARGLKEFMKDTLDPELLEIVEKIISRELKKELKIKGED